MDNKKQIILGTVIGYLTVAIQILSTLLVTPFLLRQIGENQYGIYKIVTSLTAYLSICNFGLGNALIRFLSELYARQEYEKGRKLLSLVTLLNLFAAVVAIILGLVVFANIPMFFSNSLTAPDLSLAQLVFLILLCSVIASIINDLYLSCIYVYEKFIFQKTLDLCKYILRTILLYALISNWSSAICIAIVDLGLALFILAANIYYCRCHLKVEFQICIKKGIFTDISIRPIIEYALLFFFNLLVEQLIWNTDSIIIGMRLSTWDVTVFGTGEVISAAFNSMIQIVNTLLFPRIVKGVTLNHGSKFISSTMIQIGRIQAFISMYILGGYSILGRAFICNIWLGKEYGDAWCTSLVVMCGTMLSALIASGHLFLRALNRQFFFLTSYFVIFLINAGFTYFLVARYGILAAAIATTISYVIGICCFILPYYKKVLKLQIVRFVTSLSTIFLPITGLCLIMNYVIRKCNIEHFYQILAVAVIYTFLYCILVFTFLLNQNERHQVQEMFQKVRSHLKAKRKR